MEVAASGGCSLSCDSPATPPKHAGATSSKGISSSFGWFAVIKSLDEGIWTQEVEISTWETEPSCWNALLVTRQMAFSCFDMCDSEENMEVTSFSSIAYMS